LRIGEKERENVCVWGGGEKKRESVCVSVRAFKKGEGERQGKRERESVCVCVCDRKIERDRNGYLLSKLLLLVVCVLKQN
jgi:hypothetical protein